MSTYRKKLIEVAMPLVGLSAASAFEKTGGARHGHPSTVHFWWARRPLAACRGVLFAQLVDDPSAWPTLFPDVQSQVAERKRLFKILEELVLWKNSSNEEILDLGRREIAISLARGRQADGLATNADLEVLDPEAPASLVHDYLKDVAPPVHDPFAGGGAIPLEAQRFGLRTIATDLNPVAVMINKALLEFPQRFQHRQPVFQPQSSSSGIPGTGRAWSYAEGLAEDVEHYGHWMNSEAMNRLSHLYPQVMITEDLAQQRSDLHPYLGQKRTVIAYLWARTVLSPDPAFPAAHVPLISNFFLSTKKGKERWVEPIVDGNQYYFVVREGEPDDRNAVRSGTKLGRGASFRCLVSGATIDPEYVKSEGQAGRLKTRLMTVVLEGNRCRLYIPPTKQMEEIALTAAPDWEPDYDLPRHPQYIGTLGYGISSFSQLWTPRQLCAFNTFTELGKDLFTRVRSDALIAGWDDDQVALDDGGSGATAYAQAVTVFAAFALSRFANASSTACTWDSGPAQEKVRFTFSRQAITMTWDFAETNPFSSSSGNYGDGYKWISKALRRLVPKGKATVAQADAAATTNDAYGKRIFSTDPPYYDNVPYADLSDYFYIWLRRNLKQVLPSVCGTLMVPKAAELVADRVRHGGKETADQFFLDGMTHAVRSMRDSSDQSIPITIYYAFKQSELRADGLSSTGWEVFLEAILRAGLWITGTWPVRTELANRMRAMGSNALASSVVLVCRTRPDSATTITRGDFRRILTAELPGALRAMQTGNIAPVDLTQAAIGPGMSVFTRHLRVLEHDGSSMSVRTALQLINEIVDEAVGEDEADLDRETRFALTWFTSHGFERGLYGEAETLAKARNVAVHAVDESGLLRSSAGKVRLLTRAELPDGWDPMSDKTLTVWECVQHLVKRLESAGESAAGRLLAKMGPRAEQARILAYSLYRTCEQNKWADEARAYNGLVIAWPELERLAAEGTRSATTGTQGGLFEEA